MGNIQLLSEQLANQIAAGEVVERPASVVKELVENAIDAGSHRIDIWLEESGLKFIRVLDQGSGMDAEDCEKAFLRHATSKIKTSHDLTKIRTLGFRGEALPSIAAVSNVTCISCSNQSGLGMKIVIEGGKVISVSEIAASRGTDFVVKDLFYNTPARLKYMKSLQTELNHVSDYVYRLAIATPHIAYTLHHNGQLLLQTSGQKHQLDVLGAIYGTSLSKQMLEVTGQSLDFRITGYCSKPELTRANRHAMTLIMNGRYVRSYSLVQAILQGYHTLLPIHRFPIVVLSVEMDPTLVDVNVHPAKLEVRLSKENDLCQLIEQTIRRTLHNEVLIPQTLPVKIKTESFIQEKFQLDRPSIDLSSSTNRQSKSNNHDSNKPFQYSNQQVNSKNIKSSKLNELQVKEVMASLTASSIDQNVPAIPRFPELTPIGQLHGTYLIAQNETGLYLIDQHAAHERIHYEYYLEQFGSPNSTIQELLVPITLHFTSSEINILTERLILFEQLGVNLEPFGSNTFTVRNCPTWFQAGEEQQILEELCEWIFKENKNVDLSKFREQAAILCSCKASIKANQRLSMTQLEALIDRLAQCKNPYTCPHGRPIVVSFTTYELEKMFKRVM